MKPAVELLCPTHGAPLAPQSDQAGYVETAKELVCAKGCHVPVQNGIPRFVEMNNYAAAFGRQWNEYRKTQLDSYTGTDISRSRLQRCLGGSFDAVRGKTVLEAGCGAGRFTEILLAEGAKVFACDLSSAVDANKENCGKSENYCVCQADIMKVPVAPGSFDVVMCLGVIQHTPSPDDTIARLASYVKPGGMLVIDHYRYDAADMTIPRQRVRNYLIKKSPRFSIAATKYMVMGLWPIHRLLWRTRKLPYGPQIRQKWLNISPVLDYHDAYIQLGPKLLHAWAALDTHDALTDHYKFKRTVEQIEQLLKTLGFEHVEVSYGGNGVEGRGRKPKV